MHLIEGIMEKADAAHARTVNSADEARRATYDVAIAVSGIDPEAPVFEGEANLALMHWRGADAFTPDVFRPVGRLLDRIAQAGAGPEDGDEEDLARFRVPVMSTISSGPANLEEFPYERSPQTSLSLVEVNGEPMRLISAVRQVPNIVARGGEAIMITERQLSLPASTAIVEVNVDSRNATLEDGLIPAMMGDRLVLHSEQRAPSKMGYAEEHGYVGFKNNVTSRLESHVPIAVGWNEIRSIFSRMALAHIRGPHSDPLDNSATEKPGLSPEQQMKVLITLVTGLRLRSPFSESEAEQAEETIRGLEQRANAA